MNTLEKELDILEIEDHVMVLPSNVDLALYEEGSYGLYRVIKDRLRETLFADWVPFDICSETIRTLDNGNMIFSYKAVPATALTMKTYPFRHLLVVLPKHMI